MSGNKDIRMAVRVERPYYGGDYLSIQARPVYLEWDEHTNAMGIRYFSDYAFENQELAKLTVLGQADLRNEEPPYAWDHYPGATYTDMTSADLRQLEGMVKQMRKIERGMNKMRDELGYPQTYGQNLARVGKILGVTSYGFEPTNGEERWVSDNERWRWVSAGMIDDYVNAHIERIREKVGMVRHDG
jgi:hypothetical protein